MRFVIGFCEMLNRKMGVNLCGGGRGVAKEFLDGS
jgi:hypothetical protein